MSIAELIKQLRKLQKQEPHALVYMRTEEGASLVSEARKFYLLGCDPIIMLEKTK